MAPQIEDDLVHSYTITPLPVAPGSGWRLRLFMHDDELEVRHFPTMRARLEDGLTWWHALTDQEQAERVTAFAGVTEAHLAHLLDVAYAEAETAAYEWLDSMTIR